MFLEIMGNDLPWRKEVMERFYSDVINVLKEDAKKLSKQIESSSDSKQKIEKLRILKDTMDLVFRYEDKVEKEEKSASVSYGKDKNGFVNYYDMFKTILENGGDGCVINLKKYDNNNRGTGKSYSLIKMARDFNGIYVCGNFVTSMQKKEIKNVSSVSSYIQLRGVHYKIILFDENTLKKEEIEELKSNGNILFGFTNE